MNSNTNNSEKNNNNLPARSQQELDEEFFDQHPQPTLEQARAFQAAFHEEEDEDTYYEEEYEGMYCEDDCCCLRCFEQASAPQICVVPDKEDEEDDLLSIMSDVNVDEDYEDEDEGMYNCADDCCCWRCCCVPVLSRAPQICFVPDGEELIGDVELEDNRDLEDEAQYLYDLKRRDRYPNKSLKIYHEHDPIPMDISDDEYEEQEVEDEEVEEEVEDEVDDDEYMCIHGTNCANKVCYDCVWELEQEDRRARRPAKKDEEKAVPIEAHDQAWIINVILEDAIPIPMDIDENARPQLKYQRQTSCWEHKGEMVYNGNPDGSRLYDLEDDDLTDLPDLISEDELLAEEALAAATRATMLITEAEEIERDLLDDYHENVCALHYLEEALGRGETLDRWEAERVLELRREIAYYENRRST